MLDNYSEKQIHNLKIISLNHFFTLIPDNYDDEIYEDIKSVFAKNYLRLKSIDYTKKHYVNNKTLKTNPYFEFLNTITNKVWEISNELNKQLNNLRLNHQNDITLGLTANFTRLQNSYQCAIFLIKNQFFFESISINRMIFEQINYCYKLSLMNPEEFKKLNKKRISKNLKSTNINELMRLFPDANLGYFYSYLSQLTHLDFKQITNYLTYNQQKNDYIVTYKSIFQSIESAFILFRILDLHCIIFEHTLRDYAKFDIKYIAKTKKIFKPIKK